VVAVKCPALLDAASTVRTECTLNPLFSLRTWHRRLQRYLTRPWSFAWAYKRLPHYKMLEYVCDSNREYKDPETGGTRLRIDGHDSGSQQSSPPK
jgi:hypothetical protein